jgi:BlaI family transcriptional regulator, penicillinase repressor
MGAVMNETKPSELEMQVLGVLWEQGPCTARQVLALLPDGKTRAYTTVLSVMQMMEKKKLLTHKRRGNANLYKPRQKQEVILDPFMQRLTNHVFGGSKLRLVESLLGSGKTDAKELAQLQDLIERHAQGD